MSVAPKLTKKQKKALAFRERKGKGKAKAFDEDNVVPVGEDQNTMADETQDSRVEAPAKRQEPETDGKGEGTQSHAGGAPAKKRKRGDDENAVDVEEKPTKKKKRKSKDEGDAVKAVNPTTPATEDKVKQRYILFVGNLRYTTPREAIQQHFAKCDPPPTVRLMLPKPSAPGKPRMKSKGFAFLEFTSRNALQQALKLHQSQLDGRMINVELTAGGGGKSEVRLEKLKKRNRELNEQRMKQLEKQKGSQKGTEGAAQMLRPQRYSATSGLEQVRLKERIWSVGDSTEPERNRGKKNKKRLPRALGTGVNAIPVG